MCDFNYMNFNHAVSQQPMRGDICSGVYKDPTSTCNYGDPRLKRGGKWKEVISQHCELFMWYSQIQSTEFSSIRIVHSSLKQQFWYQFTPHRRRLSLGFCCVIVSFLSGPDLICFTFNTQFDFQCGKNVAALKQLSYLACLVIVKNNENKPNTNWKPHLHRFQMSVVKWG